MFSNKDKICRACLVETTNLSPLFEINAKTELLGQKSSLADLISNLVNIELDNNEKFPNKICRNCERIIIEASTVLNQIKQNEEILKDKIKSEEITFENEEMKEFFSVTMELKEKDEEYSKKIRKESKKSEKESDLISLENDKSNEEDIREMNEPTEEHCDKIYFCIKCNKNFATKGGYKLHLKSVAHRTEATEIFKCDICSKIYTKRASLRGHKRLHRSDKHKLCPYCGKSIRYTSTFIAHLRLHTGEKAFKCEICGKCFSHEYGLTVHGRTHTGEKPFVCDVCGKGFTQRQKLVYHVLTHTTERPFKCTYCDKAFTQPANLTIHMRNHTGDKPYVCTVCMKHFTKAAALRLHCRSKVHIKRCNGSDNSMEKVDYLSGK